MDVAFWISLCGVVYAYFGYPAVLVVAARLTRARNNSRFPGDALPSISIVIPAHNEAEVIGAKLENTLALPYPGAAEIIVVSDGSSDGTEDIILSHRADERLVYIGLSERKGKANALNQGVSRATGEVVVFSDASIILDEHALVEIVQPFADPAVGCVSGEDKIAGRDGEGLYGRYELFLRRMESRLGSIVGASGSFYAQRRELVQAFPEGVAPDFLSVLNTVKSGSRAVSSKQAFGYMTSVSDSAIEFKRKVRTLIRGMTALFRKAELLNPVRYPLVCVFSTVPQSHALACAGISAGSIRDQPFLAGQDALPNRPGRPGRILRHGDAGNTIGRDSWSLCDRACRGVLLRSERCNSRGMGALPFRSTSGDLGSHEACPARLTHWIRAMREAIRILDLRDSPWVDGPGRTILETAEHLDRSKFELIIGGFRSGEAGENCYLNEARNRGLPVREIEERRAFDFEALRRIVRIVKDDAIEVIHTHDFRTDVMGLLAAKRCGVPVVSTCHGWITNNLKGRLYRAVDLRLLRLFDHVVTVSDTMKQQLVDSGLPAERLTSIPNALIVDDYMPDTADRAFREELGVGDDAVLIVSIGRLSPEKGHAVLMRALAALRETHPGFVPGNRWQRPGGGLNQGRVQ